MLDWLFHPLARIFVRDYKLYLARTQLERLARNRRLPVDPIRAAFNRSQTQLINEAKARNPWWLKLLERGPSGGWRKRLHSRLQQRKTP